MTTGERPLNLIGLAFSGGGIRSATLNLGVLQGLQELDLLRNIDYLSTVSGGGFIGSWLVTNVRRSGYWLGRLSDWSDSIAHLRSHSNYLVPRSGILSADTWNLANSWFRNAFLIQLTGLTWLFTLLLATVLGMRAFFFIGISGTPPFSIAGISIGSIPLAGVVALIAGIVTLWSILYNLEGTDLVAGGVRRARAGEPGDRRAGSRAAGASRVGLSYTVVEFFMGEPARKVVRVQSGRGALAFLSVHTDMRLLDCHVPRHRPGGRRHNDRCGRRGGRSLDRAHEFAVP